MNFFEKNPRLSWTITVLIAIAIFAISSITFPPSGAGGLNLKATIYHIGAFFFLQLFLAISLVRGTHNRFGLLALSFIISFAYGISDELHQFFVPGRYTSLEDVFLNTIGILAATTFYTFRMKYKN